ncbi:hypothetical protein WMY93_000295 [Mugilogobius chulae]|uniref:Uncharacterized protein n=1 Tax=Mugilogobius chulae TaxID=88201 RepID=A0AAW0Q1U4_9GOBI
MAAVAEGRATLLIKPFHFGRCSACTRSKRAAGQERPLTVQRREKRVEAKLAKGIGGREAPMKATKTLEQPSLHRDISHSYISAEEEKEAVSRSRVALIKSRRSPAYRSSQKTRANPPATS